MVPTRTGEGKVRVVARQRSACYDAHRLAAFPAEAADPYATRAESLAPPVPVPRFRGPRPNAKGGSWARSSWPSTPNCIVGSH